MLLFWINQLECYFNLKDIDKLIAASSAEWLGAVKRLYVEIIPEDKLHCASNMKAAGASKLLENTARFEYFSYE